MIPLNARGMACSITAACSVAFAALDFMLSTSKWILPCSFISVLQTSFSESWMGVPDWLASFTCWYPSKQPEKMWFCPFQSLHIRQFLSPQHLTWRIPKTQKGSPTMTLVPCPPSSHLLFYLSIHSYFLGELLMFVFHIIIPIFHSVNSAPHTLWCE